MKEWKMQINGSVSRWWFDVRMCQRAIQWALLPRMVEVKGHGLMLGGRFGSVKALCSSKNKYTASKGQIGLQGLEIVSPKKWDF